MAELQLIIVFNGRHFVRHLGICYRICVKLLQLMCAVIMHNSVKNEVSILINGWVTANYSVSQLPFCSPSWDLSSDFCQTSRTEVRCHYVQFSEKNEVSILINGWVTANYSVSRPPFCLHLGICNPICVKLLRVMSGVIPRNLKKNDVSISNRFPGVHKRGILTHTDSQTDRHTHTHTWR